MRLLFFGVACAAILCIAVPANAASALSLLNTDGSINQLEDDDWEFLASGGDNILEVGEFLVGMFTIPQVFDVYPVDTSGSPRSAATNGATFTGVFVLKIASKVNVGGILPYAFSFAPATAAEWAALGLGLPAPTGAGTVGLIYDDDSSPFVDPNTGTVASSLATATDGTLLWEVGFRGDAGESWTAAAATDDISLVGPGGLQFVAYLNTTADAAGPKVLKHDWLIPGADGIGGALGLFAEWQIDGRREGGSVGDFDLRTDSDIWIKPTPEPASLALLGLGLAAVGGVVYRRRRKA